MSARHRHRGLPISDPELEAHLRAERQRVRAALAGLTGSPRHAEEVDEPGPAYRVPRRHDPERARHRPAARVRHWKDAAWKRRSAARRAKAARARRLALRL